MQVQDVLFELAPEFLNGVAPGRIGGQQHHLDR